MLVEFAVAFGNIVWNGKDCPVQLVFQIVFALWESFSKIRNPVSEIVRHPVGFKNRTKNVNQIIERDRDRNRAFYVASIFSISLYCSEIAKPAFAGFAISWRAERVVKPNVIEAVKAWLNSEEPGILLTMLKQISG